MVKKILSIIRDPKIVKKLLRAVKYRIDRVQGAFWCKRKAVTSKEAVDQIIRLTPRDTSGYVGSADNISFYKKFEKEIIEAQKRQERCPVKMGGPGDLELIYRLCEHIQAKRIIETGVAWGWSSLAFLLSIKDREDAKLISTDLPYSQETAEYAGCVIPEKLRKNWIFIKKPDDEALPEALSILSEIDICHYDSDKTYKGRIFAYPLLWEALRKGGIFISDDIGDNLAFKKFAKKVGIQPIVVRSNKKYVGVLVK